jgi:pimeloyl-ACP methyl ester carboxylesterase
MSRKKILLIGMAAILAIGSAFYAANRANASVAGFYLWRVLSSRPQNGAYADVNGIRLYYERFGRGTPVLVLHGGLGSLEDMRHQIAALSSNHLVIAPDSRGHGRSTDGSGPLGYSQMADDMAALLDVLHISKVDIVGFSDGGIIGLDLAMHHSERVGRLITIGANYDVSGLVDGSLAEPSPQPDHWPMLNRKVYTMWRTQPHYSLANLHQIKSQTLVVAGEHDLIRRDHTMELAHAIPNAQVCILKGAGHGPPSEGPRPNDSVSLGFLDYGLRPSHCLDTM